jgi:hypothetical protein
VAWLHRVVRFLLQAVRTSIKDVASPLTPLFKELPIWDDEEFIQMLFNARVNIYQRGGEFGSALGAAYASYEHKVKVIERLLDGFIGEALAIGQFWSLIEREGDRSE